MNCRNCNKKFHYCTSCDMDYYMNDGYCSYNCWIHSEYYTRIKEQFKSVFSILREENKKVFKDFLLEVIDHPLYEQEIIKWIREFEDYT